MRCWASLLVLVACAHAPVDAPVDEPPRAAFSPELELLCDVAGWTWDNRECDRFPTWRGSCQGLRLDPDGSYLAVGGDSCIGRDTRRGRYAFHAIDGERFVVVFERAGLLVGRRVGDTLEIGGVRLWRRPGPAPRPPTRLPREVQPPPLVGRLLGTTWRDVDGGAGLRFFPDGRVEIEADGCRYVTAFGLWPTRELFVYLREHGCHGELRYQPLWPLREAGGLQLVSRRGRYAADD